MGFWVGFTRQFNTMQDRRERRELLMKELGASRQEELLKLTSARTSRTEAKTKEQASMKLLQQKVGNAEGGEEWLAAIASSRLATETVSMLAETEKDALDQGRSLKLEGSALISAFTPFAADDGPEIRPSINLRRALANPDSLTEDSVYFEAMQEAAQLGAPKNESVLSVNTDALRSSNSRDRTEAEEQFNTQLARNLSLRGPSVRPDVLALGNNENLAAQSEAMNKWVYSPEGFQVYSDMVGNQEVPSYQAIREIGGTFQPLKEAYELRQNWDTLSPEEQEEALGRYQFLQPHVGE